MNALTDGLSMLADAQVALCILMGLLLGLLVGAFPGITATMAVAVAATFTMTLDPVPGLAVLLTIYVAANFGDRVPAILVNTPGTPASIATTFDGYPMARQGRAGLALVLSAMVTAVGVLASMIVFVVAAVPVANFALEFGPAEMFALVLFGLTVMITIASGSLVKGVLAGLLGLFLGTVGRDPISGDPRFTFGLNDLSDGVNFIAVIIGLFGIAELLDQMLTHRQQTTKPVSNLGQWWPTREDYRRSAKPTAIGVGVGSVVGVVPAAGGDIAGLIGWDRARQMSKRKEEFGKGSVEGVAAADAASSATLGGSLTTTMALGIPGDSVMAVMIGSMIIWGIQPGPSLFTSRPELVVVIAALMIIATLLALAASLVRMKAMVKIMDVPQHYLWPTILVFCVVGTYATTNNVFTVIVMLAAGVLGLLMKRAGFPAGPVVLGLLLGPLAEANLRRALLIDGPSGLVSNPISAVLLGLTLFALLTPLVRRLRASRTDRPDPAVPAPHEKEKT